MQRWSGQTEIASSELPIDSLNTQQTSTPYDMTNKVFLTPFEIVESEPQVEVPVILKAVENAANLVQTPICPRCNGEMIKRVAKTGARQGQPFYGCAQFPKCRGVVSVG